VTSQRVSFTLGMAAYFINTNAARPRPTRRSIAAFVIVCVNNWHEDRLTDRPPTKPSIAHYTHPMHANMDKHLRPITRRAVRSLPNVCLHKTYEHLQKNVLVFYFTCNQRKTFAKMFCKCITLVTCKTKH